MVPRLLVVAIFFYLAAARRSYKAGKPCPCDDPLKYRESAECLRRFFGSSSPESQSSYDENVDCRRTIETYMGNILVQALVNDNGWPPRKPLDDEYDVTDDDQLAVTDDQLDVTDAVVISQLLYADDDPAGEHLLKLVKIQQDLCYNARPREALEAAFKETTTGSLTSVLKKMKTDGSLTRVLAHVFGERLGTTDILGNCGGVAITLQRFITGYDGLINEALPPVAEQDRVPEGTSVAKLRKYIEEHKGSRLAIRCHISGVALFGHTFIVDVDKDGSCTLLQGNFYGGFSIAESLDESQVFGSAEALEKALNEFMKLGVNLQHKDEEKRKKNRKKAAEVYANLFTPRYLGTVLWQLGKLKDTDSMRNLEFDFHVSEYEDARVNAVNFCAKYGGYNTQGKVEIPTNISSYKDFLKMSM